MKVESLIHSPLNYMGGKYKILKEILPLFPDEVNTFVDLFTGGLNVGINISAKSVIANDQLTFLMDIYQYFQSTEWEAIIDGIRKRIGEFSLTRENKAGYLTLRDEYNANHSPLDLFILTCYSFNHQIRFNSKWEFNTPFGTGRSSFNKSIETNLEEFVRRLKANNITLSSGDFLSVPLDGLTPQDFVYCDPPYLITSGSYNSKRGFKGWSETEEVQLLNLLDGLNERGIRFALSNVLQHKGMQNDILTKWASKYTINFISNTYSNCSYHLKSRNTKTVEVLITNFTKQIKGMQ